MYLTIDFANIRLSDLPDVGGKNASLGEMFASLSEKGIQVPDGFAIKADAYKMFLHINKLEIPVSERLSDLDIKNFSNLKVIASDIRNMILNAPFPDRIAQDILQAFRRLADKTSSEKTYAVRSSATAEDLPNASFAGQQESFLNVKGEDKLIKAVHRCFASLFTDRAIKYRHDKGFDHMKVYLSVGIQSMVRSDLACSGVIFTIEPDTGFDKVLLLSGSWGLGENVVQGTVNPDEFLVYKPFLHKVNRPVFSHKTGTKAKTMIFSALKQDEISRPEDAVLNILTPESEKNKLILTDAEIIQLAKWACLIENHYQCAMDVEWAKDGLDGKLYIVQARPETVHSRKDKNLFKQYALTEKAENAEKICSGAAIGNRITAGAARILHSASDSEKLLTDEILVTERTDPDWDPLLKKAGAIITNQGGRTSHAAIVARELGAIAVVGTGNATEKIKDGEMITVVTSNGCNGEVYRGKLNWIEKETDLSTVPATKTKAMLILAHPDEAFRLSALPNDGVGLMRMEFIISNSIGIHPMALVNFGQIKEAPLRAVIEKAGASFQNKQDFFVHKLAEATAKIAAAFYPKEVIVRMSDFKSNEYANLIGGYLYEPKEENPMIGFRGASRYDHSLYRDAYELECRAMKMVREDMGFSNVKLMIPFCRTVTEAQKVISLMERCGLKRKVNALEVYVMVEIPSNALQAEEFAKYFDGFSIGSNDLTQLTLGADRDSELLAEVFNPFDPAVMQLIEMTLSKAKKTGTHTGLCGQAPSDYPEYAGFLIKNGIDSISFNPDALIQGIYNIAKAESQLTKI